MIVKWLYVRLWSQFRQRSIWLLCLAGRLRYFNDRVLKPLFYCVYREKCTEVMMFSRLVWNLLSPLFSETLILCNRLEKCGVWQHFGWFSAVKKYMLKWLFSDKLPVKILTTPFTSVTAHSRCDGYGHWRIQGGPGGAMPPWPRGQAPRMH